MGRLLVCPDLGPSTLRLQSTAVFSDRTSWHLASNAFTRAIEEARAAGKPVLDLSTSNPTRIGLEFDSQAILQAFASPQVLDYDPQAKGLLIAREAVCAYYRDEHAVRDLHPDRIVLTTSTSEGYSFVFRLLCNAGDELLVPKPSYPLFEFLADLQDVKLVPYPLIYDEGWRMDFHSLEQSVTERTRGVVVVHPNNPTGSYVHADELEPLNAFCRAHGLALIVDEVFLDYRLHVGTAALGCPTERSSTAPTFAANSDVLTFTLSGLSKISALPQMKVAWVVTSGPSQQVAEAIARLDMIADTYLSMNAPTQWAVPVLLQQRKDIQKQLLGRVNHNLSEFDRQLASQKACQRLCLEGGWCAVLRVPVTRSDEELAIALVREHGVMVHPGHFYDFPRDGYLVLSLICKEQEFTDGIARVLGVFHQHP
jgi:alanine-synthesizing transaminase